MGDNNTPFQGHPFYTALSIFNAAVRTPLNIVGAFWRPWFTDPWFTDDENKKVQTAHDAERHEVEISLPKTENQLAANAQSAAMAEEVSHPTKRKRKAAKPPMKRAATEKKPKPPTKHTLKEKLEREREEQAQKTERLRKLRQAKEAAEGRKKSPNNGHAGTRNH
jgi:predicted ATP-dependent protease